MLDNTRLSRDCRTILAIACGVATLVLAGVSSSAPGFAQNASTNGYKYNDSHFHLTNYIQEGTKVGDYVKMMDGVVKRSTLFGIPLQQMWEYGNTGEYAPTYYLQTDAPLYYYSFTDAAIAMAYKSLPAEQQARLDPMITGFNPADMYAADHIKRVLLTFPGVFVGIGEFSIHKEFVSSKVAGGVATLTDPALGRIFDFAAEVGLVVLLHNDADVPFPKPGQEPYMLAQFKDLLLKHPNTTVIWAHAGLGRVVRPVKDQLEILDRALGGIKNLNIDISWDETAKYITANPETVAATASLIEKYPDRFLFGSDVVAPASIDAPLAVYNAYAPLWKALQPETVQKVTFANYERIFDEARNRVRAWEKANALDNATVRK
jgi:predicted TIM-barrel fold metal-dependent hydrolase